MRHDAIVVGAGFAGFECRARYCAEAPRVFPRPYEPLFNRDAVAATDRRTLATRLKELELSPEDEDWLSGVLATVDGGPASESGLTLMYRWWMLAGATPQGFFDMLARYRLAGGTSALAEAIAADAEAEIRLGCAIEEIVADAGGVRVRADAGETLSAPVAIVAVPVNVWPQLRFSPPLPVADAALSGEGVGTPHGYKVFAHVRSGPGRIAVFQPEGWALTRVASDIELAEGQNLVAFGADPWFDPTDREQVPAAFAAALPKIEVVDVRCHDWSRDEVARGGWAWHRPGQLAAQRAERVRSHGRVIPATGDLAEGWAGGIDGAIKGGIRGARLAAGASVEDPPRIDAGLGDLDLDRGAHA